MTERAASPPVAFVGLTGAVAAGKSEALAAFERLGAETISTDGIVHELLTSDEVAAALVERWGDAVAPGGRVDRARVSGIAFERPEELRWLEAHLHPLVRERVASWRASLPADAEIAVVEVPLLFETEMDSLFDATVCVVADDEVRRTRAGDRGTGALAERSARQLSQAEKATRATFVVENDGSREELAARLGELMPKLRASAEA